MTLCQSGSSQRGRRRNRRLETSLSHKQVLWKVVPKAAPRIEFQLENTSLHSSSNKSLIVPCRQASLLGSFPLRQDWLSYKAQGRVMQSRNWYFLLGLSSSDLSTTAKPAGLAPRSRKLLGARADGVWQSAGLLSAHLPLAPFGEH